jgi:hypothetical protein
VWVVTLFSKISYMTITQHAHICSFHTSIFYAGKIFVLNFFINTAPNNRSRATLLDATGRHHFTPMSAMVINFGVKNELWHCEIAVSKLAFKRQETNPLLSSSKQQVAKNGQFAMIKVEELNNLSSHQTLTADKNWRSD